MMDAKLAKFLIGKGIDSRHVEVLEENEVDSYVFGLLRDSDFYLMFKNKVGVARKLMILQESWGAADINDASTWPDSASHANSEPMMTDNLEVFDISMSGKPINSESLPNSCNSKDTSKLDSNQKMIAAKVSVGNYNGVQSNTLNGAAKGRSVDTHVELTPGNSRNAPVSWSVNNEMELGQMSDQATDTTKDADSSLFQESDFVNIFAGKEMSKNATKGKRFTGPKVIPLPIFSKQVEKALSSGNGAFCMNKVINEIGYHIIAFGDMRSKGSYLRYCSALCQKYPCLRYPGKHEYSYISKKISQKLRNLRSHRRAAGQNNPNGETTANLDGDDPITAGLQKAYEFLDIEFSRGNCEWRKLLTLFNRVFPIRRLKLEKIEPRNARQILQTIPTLGDLRLVREDMNQLLPISIVEMKENYVEMLHTIQTLLDIVSGKEDEAQEANTLLQLQQQLSDRRVKSKYSANLLTLKMENEEVISQKDDPPHLVVTVLESGRTHGSIHAHGKAIPCVEGEGICGMIIDLIACYSAWGIVYPKEYPMLGFFEQFVIDDCRSKFPKTNKYVEFEKRYLTYKDSNGV